MAVAVAVAVAETTAAGLNNSKKLYYVGQDSEKAGVIMPNKTSCLHAIPTSLTTRTP